MCWIYNDHVDRWTDRLQSPVRQIVRDGQLPTAGGVVARFPHYLTQGQNPGALIRLSPIQVNLLAHLSCWNVMENQDRLRKLFETS